MAEFDDALGRILNNPAAMAQIMGLAQSLGTQSPPGENPPPGNPPSGNAPPPGNPPSGNAPPGNAPPGNAPPGNTMPPGETAMPPPGTVDAMAVSPLLRKLLPLLREGQESSNARQFLYALRPYLKPRRQENVERALQLARLFRAGKRFLSDWEG